ncbi:MFS transporter [Saccharomonospora sp. NPDC046836]|uniref:MFS transporter n=1 Tax=Saccharomonospora sp. NPDC046836 TaxID=3156921 RepID=UPI003403C9F5
MATARLGPAYGRLWSATALANLGDGIRNAALPLLAAALTTDPVLVAGVAVAANLPWLVCGLLAGAVVDRVDRRKLIVVTDLARITLLATLIVSVALDAAALPLLYVTAFACGIGETLRDTAASTLVPQLVPSAEFDRANGRLVNAEVAGNELIGPPLGGYLFGVAMVLPFAVNNGALAVAVVLILALPGALTPVPAHSRSTLRADIAAGVRWLARHRQLRAVTALGAVLTLTDGAWFAILVLYVTEVLGLPSAAYGLLLAAGAVGGLAGGGLAAWVLRHTGTAVTLIGTLVLAAAAQAAMGLTTAPVVTGLALAAGSFAFGVWNVGAVTLRQRVTAPELLGRVTSAYRTVAMGAVPVGALLGGLLADAHGLRAPLLAGVPLLLVAAALGARSLRAAG